MKSEEQLNKMLEDLKVAIRLREEGIVSMNSKQHIQALRKMEFLEEILK